MSASLLIDSIKKNLLLFKDNVIQIFSIITDFLYDEISADSNISSTIKKYSKFSFLTTNISKIVEESEELKYDSTNGLKKKAKPSPKKQLHSNSSIKSKSNIETILKKYTYNSNSKLKNITKPSTFSKFKKDNKSEKKKSCKIKKSTKSSKSKENKILKNNIKINISNIIVNRNKAIKNVNKFYNNSYSSVKNSLLHTDKNIKSFDRKYK